jgi:hypothetical protein
MLKHLKFYLTGNRSICLLMFLLSFLILFSCYRDPISIDLSRFGKNIVIQGSITNDSGPHQVRITRTVSIHAYDEFPPVSGASVSIADNLKNSVQLQETETGVYMVSSWEGVPGRIYTLRVIIEGKTYTASSTMPKPLYLETLNLTKISPDNDMFALSCSFLDQVGREDYCLLKIYHNTNLIDYHLYQDKLSDGQKVMFDDFNVLYNIYDVATVELLTIDKPTYEFFKTLDIIAENGEDDFGSTLIPVTTLNPSTNLDNGAMGYFSAHTIHRRVRTFQ